MRRVTTLLVLGAAMLAAPAVAHACPVCYGDIGGPAARGVNNGILAMLGVVVAVQFGFAALFVGMWRRSKQPQSSNESLTEFNGGKE